MKKFIATFYKFISVTNIKIFSENINKFYGNNDIKGSIIIALEGINGSIYGLEDDVKSFVKKIKKIKELSDIKVRFSETEVIPYKNFKFKIKKEIVTIGDKEIQPSQKVGKYIDPDQWDEFISQKDVVVIDTRNKYEVKIGTFKNSINPKINNFREFPIWWNENKDSFHGKKIAMFCTGGIRCEKSTSLVINNGFEEVYHLKGGIIDYLKLPQKSISEWEGECFVFDQRVSITNFEEKGNYKLCFGCRRPISFEDTKHFHYEEGVSCNECFYEHSFKRKEGFRERQRQKVLEEKNIKK